MEKIQIFYDGKLRNTCTHIRSGSNFKTDAPIDNRGKGKNFSPTDLLVTALASCMMTIMGITARTSGFCIDGSSAEVRKKMSTSPRRISLIAICFHIKGALTYKDKNKLIKAAKHCPVSKSIHPDIKEEFSFEFEK